MFEQMKGEHQIPSLFLKPWPEELVNKPSAYHYTSYDGLKRIATDGLLSLAGETNTLGENEERKIFDVLVAQVAKEMGMSFNRGNFVFLALPESLDTANWKRFGEVKLEIKVDENDARVYDRRLHSYGVIAYLGTTEGADLLEKQHPKGTQERERVERLLRNVVKNDWQDYFREYLSTSVPLVDFLKLSKDDQLRIFMPEVLVPSPIIPDRIRLAQ